MVQIVVPIFATCGFICKIRGLVKGGLDYVIVESLYTVLIIIICDTNAILCTVYNIIL